MKCLVTIDYAEAAPGTYNATKSVLAGLGAQYTRPTFCFEAEPDDEALVLVARGIQHILGVSVSWDLKAGSGHIVQIHPIVEAAVSLSDSADPIKSQIGSGILKRLDATEGAGTLNGCSWTRAEGARFVISDHQGAKLGTAKTWHELEAITSAHKRQRAVEMMAQLGVSLG